jgi:hypothetical protein
MQRAVSGVSAVATFPLAIMLMCFGLGLATVNASQNPMGTEANIAGSWSSTMADPSGVGLVEQFDLRPDGTYRYYRVFRSNAGCDRVLSYEREFRILGELIEFFPSAGTEGCAGSESVLTEGELVAQRPSRGNWRSRSALTGGRCVSILKVVKLGNPAFHLRSRDLRHYHPRRVLIQNPLQSLLQGPLNRVALKRAASTV